MSYPSGTLNDSIYTTAEDYVIPMTYGVIQVDALLNGITVTLPTAVGINGVSLIIRKIDSSVHTVTIETYGSELIDSSYVYYLTAQYAEITLVSDGTNWDIIDKSSEILQYPWKGIWVTSTSYKVNDCVQYNGSGYVCLTAHVSGTFSTDLAAGKWSLLVNGIPTTAVTVTGSKGSNAALTSLIAALVTQGLIVDSTS